ncbi:hypothetical protein ABIA33_004676 [Streptacidiphilus sp. MAP12-16]
MRGLRGPEGHDGAIISWHLATALSRIMPREAFRPLLG